MSNSTRSAMVKAARNDMLPDGYTNITTVYLASGAAIRGRWADYIDADNNQIETIDSGFIEFLVDEPEGTYHTIYLSTEDVVALDIIQKLEPEEVE
jgi:hypothetical protein